MLEQLNPNNSYDFLGGETSGQKLQELKQQTATLDQLDKSFNAIEPGLTDAEKVSFEERMKIYGGTEAIHWLLQQHGNPQNGQ
jgi:hypothetical protein